MKYGTLACWLFGHKFVEEIWKDGTPNIKKTTVYDGEKLWISKKLDYCCRCGIERKTE